MNNTDKRKKRAIDRLYEAVAFDVITVEQRYLLGDIIHILFSWSPEAAEEINNDPTMEYLKNEQPL